MKKGSKTLALLFGLVFGSGCAGSRWAQKDIVKEAELQSLTGIPLISLTPNHLGESFINAETEGDVFSSAKNAKELNARIAQLNNKMTRFLQQRQKPEGLSFDFTDEGFISDMVTGIMVNANGSAKAYIYYDAEGRPILCAVPSANLLSSHGGYFFRYEKYTENAKNSLFFKQLPGSAEQWHALDLFMTAVKCEPAKNLREVLKLQERAFAQYRKKYRSDDAPQAFKDSVRITVLLDAVRNGVEKDRALLSFIRSDDKDPEAVAQAGRNFIRFLRERISKADPDLMATTVKEVADFYVKAQSPALALERRHAEDFLISVARHADPAPYFGYKSSLLCFIPSHLVSSNTGNPSTQPKCVR